MEMHFVKGQENGIVLERLRGIELPVLAWYLALHGTQLQQKNSSFLSVR